MDDIYAAARARGLLTEFHDAHGHLHVADPAVLEAVLQAMPREPPRENAQQPVEIRPAYRLSDRLWLLTIQLYSVVSSCNWGIGDFSDLSRLIEITAESGCAGIGLNPLHVLFIDRPDECSPYAPNSRLFLNPLYIDVGVLPEFDADFVERAAIEAVRAQPCVAYAAVARLKLSALRQCFSAFRAEAAAGRRASFEAFRREHGVLLQRFASFEVLRQRLKASWWEWPDEWQQPDEARLRRFREGEARDDIEFVEYLQWCADTQLSECIALAKNKGMRIGLYLDIAVGVQPGGFDAWHEQEAISRKLSVGAPPDILNTAGQDWGLAGFNAPGLLTRRLEPFRQMIAAAMRYAGAIRVDHILGLNRLYLIPSGYSAREGVYAKMPLDQLLQVVSEESRHSRCVVIGEDLGTVPDGFREKLAEWGVYSYKVMLFERRHDGSFISPSDYAADALVTFNTHDLSSFEGWRSFHDLAIKRSLGLDPGESDDERHATHRALAAALDRLGISSHDYYGVIDYLARAPSRLLAIALEDLVGVKDQPNVPGTIDEHPNWRRRLPVTLEELHSRLDIGRLTHVLAARRP